MLIPRPTVNQPVLQVHPSRRCNLSCNHCYTSSGPNEEGEIDASLMNSCVSEAASLGYRQLAVSGGEPLLYRGLTDLLSRAKNLGMITTVTTNAMLASFSRWNALAGFVDLAAISIDGLPQEHDQIRGQCGAFDQALAGLEVIRASGVSFALIFTLTQFNVDSLGFVVELAAACGANGVQVHPLTLYGRAASQMADAHPDELELLAAICESIRLGESLGITVIIDAISQQQLLEYRNYFVPSHNSSDLTDISPTLILQQDGTVVPLTHNVNPSLWLGSLHQESLSSMSDRWLKTGRSAELVQAYEKTWDELTASHSPAATYWFDEVAARTNL